MASAYLASSPSILASSPFSSSWRAGPHGEIGLQEQPLGEGGEGHGRETSSLSGSGVALSGGARARARPAAGERAIDEEAPGPLG